MGEAYIIDACRTPRGVGNVKKGALAHLHPQNLSAVVLRALAERNSLFKKGGWIPRSLWPGSAGNRCNFGTWQALCSSALGCWC